MKKPLMILISALVASGLAWSVAGGISIARGQSPSTSTEIHRAHRGSFAPEPGKTVFILILGSDAGAPLYKRGGSTETGRSDSIHILAMNPKLGTITMIGIPRDSFVPIPGHGTHKINAAMSFGGPQLTIQTVEALSGVTFDYYMLTNFQDFSSMAQEFGGLTVKVPFNMHDPQGSGANFDKGVRHLSGAQVLQFARDRHDAPLGDFDRSFDQGIVMQAAQIEARRRVGKDPRQILIFLRSIRRHVIMDIPLAESLRLGLLALRIDPKKVYNFVTPGGTGTTADGSSVLLNARAMQMLHDVADDGVVESKG